MSWKAEMQRWLRQHHGAITAAKLQELQCPRSSVERMVERRELIPITRGVFRTGHTRKSDLQLMSAISQLIPSAAIGFTSAGKLHGLRKMTNNFVHVLIPHDHSVRITGALVHRCRNIDADLDLITRDDGVRLTNVARTLFDVADMIGLENAISAIEDALAKQLCTFDDLVSMCRRLSHPRRPGTRTFRAALSSRDPWREALDSNLEVLVLLAIERLGLPTPVCQFPMTLPNGTDIEIDFAWPEQRVALEIDHTYWHDGSQPARRDKRRDRQLGVVAWQPMRITDAEVEEDVDAALADVAEVLRQRTAA